MRERLNDEHLSTCQKLTAALACKRPSPLVNGTAAARACGINGMIVDARHTQREIQEEALRRRMIPYLPSDGEGDGKSQQGRQGKP